jgi:hypothetical protein
VDPRTGLDDVKKLKFLTLRGLQLRPLDRPERSQLLYDCTTAAHILLAIHLKKKARRMKWAGHAAGIGAKINNYKVWVRKDEVDRVKHLRASMTIILK